MAILLEWKASISPPLSSLSRFFGFRMASVSIFVSLIFFHLVFPSAQHANTDIEKCPASFDCGFLGTIKFPFTTAQRQDCGLFPIQGCEKHVPELFKSIKLVKNYSFAVVKVLGPTAIIVKDMSLQKLLQTRKCSAFSNNFTLPPNSPLASFHVSPRVMFFRCNRSLNINPPSQSFLKYACPDDNLDIFYSIYPPNHSYSSLSACSTVELPNKDLPNKDPFTFASSEVSLGVQLSEDCIECYNQMGGQCQLDHNKEFHCIKEDNTSSIIKLELALGLGLGGLLVVIAGGLMVRAYTVRLKMGNPTNQMIESFLEIHASLRTRRYTFSEIKKVTKNFGNKLGQGGYGSVYKGQLLDGRPVAVKILAESKGNGEEFINEVASISNTSHVNIVTLLGFCIEGSNRALIYEFMSNGSLEKFLQEGQAKMVDCQLDCKTLYDIAIGVARGLEYLHRGCNTKILHFDIKPHNILLDEHFFPKISDFGLAKVCPERESTISLNCARGTIGYIAPEVFSRNFGTVSHKSDVYSYGMMVLEIIGREKKINAEVNHSNEFYVPHWIYKSLESGQELELQCIRNDIDEERMKKMMLVGLWCIQTDPTDRPTMTNVIQMLEGSLECLQIPPKPYLFSPLTSPTHYSSTCTSVLWKKQD